MNGEGEGEGDRVNGEGEGEGDRVNGEGEGFSLGGKRSQFTFLDCILGAGDGERMREGGGCRRCESCILGSGERMRRGGCESCILGA